MYTLTQLIFSKQTLCKVYISFVTARKKLFSIRNTKIPCLTVTKLNKHIFSQDNSTTIPSQILMA